MMFVQGVEMDGVPPNTFTLNLNGFIASALHNVLLETTILAIKAVVFSSRMIGEVSAWNAAGHDECITNGGFPIPELYVVRKPEPENKDASETEGDNEDDNDDDDDGVVNKEDGDEEDDDVSGDEGEDDDDPEDVPNVNGDGGSDDEEDEEDDDDGDEENEDDEDDEDDDEEEEDEEVPQPPAKKRK